jgi:hypothetical protein
LTRESEMQNDAKLGLSDRLLVTKRQFFLLFIISRKKNGNGKEIKGNIGRIE